MTTAIVKPSKIVKDATSNVRDQLDVLERAKSLYLAQIKRAEAEFFDRLERAIAISRGEEKPANGAAPEADQHV